MILTLRGWDRNHGNHKLTNKVLESDNIKKGHVSITRDQVKAKVLHPDSDLQSGVAIYFAAKNVRLGGDYFGALTLSKKEIFRLFKASIEGDEAGAVLKELSET